MSILLHLDVSKSTGRVAIGQGKVREILFFFKVREKSGNFAKLVRKKLYTKKVREKSVAGILFILND